MLDRYVVFGAAGDLVTRHLLPALALLVEQGRLPPSLDVVGVGREPLAGPEYRALATARLAQHAAHVDAAARGDLVRRLDFVRADLSDEGAAAAALAPVVAGAPVVAYLALPAAVYPPAVRALRAAGLAAGSRLVLEKPFGEDAATARALDRVLHAAVPERDVFRVDHFLQHQTVQDLLAARLADPLLARVWDREGVERVDVVWEETAGVGGRADFYDRTGALRDMVQSHLLQLLALVAMHPPSRLDERSLRDAKAAALRRVPALGHAQVRTRTARGRYTAGAVDGQARRGYLHEDGVDPGRGTETWACVRLEVDDPRWAGVPFVLRAGKALGRARKHVEVRLRPVAGGPLAGVPSLLRFEMAPDRVTLSLPVAGADGLPAVEPARLEAARPRQPLPASARTVLDVLRGDPTFAVRDDEAEQCWRVTDAVLAGWRAGDVPLQDYAAGSDGPLPPPGDGP